MPPEKTPASRELAQLVERQLRNWEIAQAQKAKAPPPAEEPVADFVSISREVGLPGHQVATILHERLGWPLFDRGILQTMAGDDEYRRRLYANMDERDLNWVEGFLRGLALDKYDKEDYFHRLTETVVALARRGHAVFLGRATHLILPRTAGLRVRLTASAAYCLESFCRQRNIISQRALAEVQEIEQERTRFVKKHFGVLPAEQSRQDLILNMEWFTTQDAVDMIMAALRLRGIISEP